MKMMIRAAISIRCHVPEHNRPALSKCKVIEHNQERKLKQGSLPEPEWSALGTTSV